MTDNDYEKMAHEVVDLLGAEMSVDEDEFTIRGNVKGRRFEIILDTDISYPDIEVKMVVKNKIGYIDLYFDTSVDEDEDEIDPDFDLQTRIIRDGLFLEDYSSNIINQEKRLTKLPASFLDTTIKLMSDFKIDNIEFDDHLTTIDFGSNLDELNISANDVANIITTCSELLKSFEA